MLTFSTRGRLLRSSSSSSSISSWLANNVAPFPFLYITWITIIVVANIQRGKQSAMEGDAWLLSFNDAENKLLQGSNRKKCLSILKTLRDRNLDGPGQSCITTYHLKTLLLYECEKHPHEYEWDDYNLGDRINGILLQLISCLQSRRCPHYFLPNLDLFRGRPIENTSKQIWRLVRQFIMDPASLERL